MAQVQDETSKSNGEKAAVTAVDDSDPSTQDSDLFEDAQESIDLPVDPKSSDDSNPNDPNPDNPNPDDSNPDDPKSVDSESEDDPVSVRDDVTTPTNTTSHDTVPAAPETDESSKPEETSPHVDQTLSTETAEIDHEINPEDTEIIEVQTIGYVIDSKSNTESDPKETDNQPKETVSEPVASENTPDQTEVDENKPGKSADEVKESDVQSEAEGTESEEHKPNEPVVERRDEATKESEQTEETIEVTASSPERETAGKPTGPPRGEGPHSETESGTESDSSSSSEHIRSRRRRKDSSASEGQSDNRADSAERWEHDKYVESEQGPAEPQVSRNQNSAQATEDEEKVAEKDKKLEFGPSRGKFYHHDSRLDDDFKPGEEEEVEPSKRKCDTVERWEHDLYREEDQGPVDPQDKRSSEYRRSYRLRRYGRGSGDNGDRPRRQGRYQERSHDQSHDQKRPQPRDNERPDRQRRDYRRRDNDQGGRGSDRGGRGTDRGGRGSDRGGRGNDRGGRGRNDTRQDRSREQARRTPEEEWPSLGGETAPSQQPQWPVAPSANKSSEGTGSSQPAANSNTPSTRNTQNTRNTGPKPVTSPRQTAGGTNTKPQPSRNASKPDSSKSEKSEKSSKPPAKSSPRQPAKTNPPSATGSSKQPEAAAGSNQQLSSNSSQSPAKQAATNTSQASKPDNSPGKTADSAASPSGQAKSLFNTSKTFSLSNKSELVVRSVGGRGRGRGRGAKPRQTEATVGRSGDHQPSENKEPAKDVGQVVSKQEVASQVEPKQEVADQGKNPPEGELLPQFPAGVAKPKRYSERTKQFKTEAGVSDRQPAPTMASQPPMGEQMGPHPPLPTNQMIPMDMEQMMSYQMSLAQQNPMLYQQMQYMWMQQFQQQQALQQSMVPVANPGIPQAAAVREGVVDGQFYPAHAPMYVPAAPTGPPRWHTGEGKPRRQAIPIVPPKDKPSSSEENS